MGTLAKSVLFGFLLVLFAGLMANNTPHADATVVGHVVVSTENESINIEVAFPGFFPEDIVTDNKVIIDSPQNVVFVIRFVDPATGYTIEHVNYGFTVVDESESMIVDRAALHVDDGIDPHLVPFSEAGTFTLTIDIEGTGIDRPFDTTYSGTASLMITVVPEFPVAIMAIMMGGTFAMAIGASRFKKPPPQ